MVPQASGHQYRWQHRVESTGVCMCMPTILGVAFGTAARLDADELNLNALNGRIRTLHGDLLTGREDSARRESPRYTLALPRHQPPLQSTPSPNHRGLSLLRTVPGP